MDSASFLLLLRHQPIHDLSVIIAENKFWMQPAAGKKVVLSGLRRRRLRLLTMTRKQKKEKISKKERAANKSCNILSIIESGLTFHRECFGYWSHNESSSVPLQLYRVLPFPSHILSTGQFYFTRCDRDYNKMFWSLINLIQFDFVYFLSFLGHTPIHASLKVKNWLKAISLNRAEDDYHRNIHSRSRSIHNHIKQHVNHKRCINVVLFTHKKYATRVRTKPKH